MTTPRPRLFLVDGYALIYRSFFALGEQRLTSSKGENTAIAHGTLEFLRRLLDRHRPDYIAWVHDAGDSFRHQTFADYKATRERLAPEQKADFDTGVEHVEEILRGYRIPVLSLDGYEADDVIGTLARQAVDRGVDTVIVSGDKDFVQLVRDGIQVLNPWHGRPGRTTEKWYDTTSASERLGVPPDRVIDYLALVGDSSDNVPGVRGIGEKTAHALIERWGSLDNILAHTAEVEPTRARTALETYGKNGLLSRELVTIRTDLAVTLDPDKLRRKEPDWDALRELFVRLEFRAQAQDAAIRAAPARDGTGDAVAATVPATEPATAPTALATATVECELVETTDQLARVTAAVRASGRMALDVVTAPTHSPAGSESPMRSRVVGLAISPAEGTAFYLPFGHQGPDGEALELQISTVKSAPAEQRHPNLPPLRSPELAGVRELLVDSAIGKFGHDIKPGLLVLRREDVPVTGVDFDTMLASYLLDPGRRSHALDILAVEELQRALPTRDEVVGKGRQRIPFSTVPSAAAGRYAGASAEAVMALRRTLESRLAETRADALLRDVELPLVNVLADMEWEGIGIDLPWFHSLKARFQKEREAAERAIYEEAGEQFNVNSNRQLATILFDRMGLPVRKKTTTGPSTDASVLQQLADEGHKLPALIMEYRELAKLESTYLDTLPALVNPATGRLHTSYSQAVAATGRLASSDPNLQNIPVRSDLGKDIRRGFVPRAGWEFLVADYSQIELRLLAHLSGDTEFLDAFRRGGDIHRQTASAIFGVAPDDVTPEMRGQAKTINFATIYGQGAHALSQQLKVEHAAAKAFIDAYFTRFAGVRAYLDTTVEHARHSGYVETIMGRRRYIPELKDRNFNVRAFGERTAQNSPIQGSAADLIKIAMIRVHAAMRRERMTARLLLQVHDELVFESPPDEIERLRALVMDAMTNAAQLSVPLVVDIGTGSNWLDAKA